MPHNTQLAMIAAAVVLAMPSATFAQNKKQPPRPPLAAERTWEREPTTFMGLTLGAPFETQLPACPAPSAGYNPNGPMCFERTGGGVASIDHHPQIGILLKNVVAFYPSANLGMILINIQHFDFSKLNAVLRERYGEPTNVSSAEYVTVGGAKITGQKYEWKGKQVRLLLSEYGDSLNNSSMIINTINFGAENSAVQRDAARGVAGRL